MPRRSDRTVPRRRVADDAGVHVNFITRADLHPSGTVTVWTRGASRPRIFPALEGLAGTQLTTALLDHLHINGGTWTSIATFSKQRASVKRFLFWFHQHDLECLLDPDFTPVMAWEGVLAVGGNGGEQRNFRTFLAEALAALRPDGHAHHSALSGRALPVDEHNLQGYAPEVAASIEEVAKRRVADWFRRHRDGVRQALGGDLPRDWLARPATDLTRVGDKVPHSLRAWPDDLAAAMVLLALVDDKGPNLSVILSHTADSVERAGEDTAFTTSVKARNRQVLRTPAPASGLFSYGGLLEFVTAATRVDRHLRDDGSDFARLLFVAKGDSAVMSTRQVNLWWDMTVQDWPDRAIPRPDNLSFPRLRKAARLRGERHDRVLVGQAQSTARLYLADAVPDVILIPGLIDVQNSVTAYWRGQTVQVTQEEEDAVEPLTSSKAVMDVGVAVCSSGGQSPIDPDRPCGLGPVACFVCPNGYRTPEVIPGLLAAVQFTDGIRKYEPAEWLTGEAPVLNTLARKALAQFPAPVVAAASDEDVHNARALVACVYLEGRRRD